MNAVSSLETVIKSYAPGRAELLGNHTDYNEGLVLSIAVERGVRISGQVRNDDRICIHSRDLGQNFEGAISSLSPSVESPWANYLLGIFAEFQKRNLPLGGVNIDIESNLPQGAGLSSSAALEIATALLLQNAFGSEIPRLELARIGQAAEHHYAGVRCGLLDQISSLFGLAGQATFIDCRTYEIRNLPLPSTVRFVIANSPVKHALVGGEYQERRESCEKAALTLGIPALRDIDVGALERRSRELPLLALKRARHITGENERVAAALAGLEKGDVSILGEAMFASHRSSIENFENSCPELDLLVQAARTVPGCLGARLSGGGFGGATINLVLAEAETDLITALERAVPGTLCISTQAANGAHLE